MVYEKIRELKRNAKNPKYLYIGEEEYGQLLEEYSVINNGKETPKKGFKVCGLFVSRFGVKRHLKVI